MIQKQVIIRLFYNVSNMSSYVQIGETLFITPTKVVEKLRDKEGLEIRHAKDIKEIQLMCIEDNKPENSL